MEAAVGLNKVVGLIYTLKDSEGEIIEERSSEDPLMYIQGADQLLPAVEKAVDGKPVGFKAEIHLAAADAYGDYDEELVAEVERSEFPKDVNITIGMKFETQDPDGEPVLVEVIEVDSEKIVVDGNHPLAGIDLQFALEVKSIREATQEELEHGHVHGEGGHLH